MGCPCIVLRSPKHAFWKPIIYQLSLPKSILEGFAAETGKGFRLHQSISRTEISYHPEYMQFLEAISHCQEDILVLQRSGCLPSNISILHAQNAKILPISPLLALCRSRKLRRDSRNDHTLPRALALRKLPPHSLLKSFVCFLCEILDYHSFLPIMGSAHSLVLRLILLLSFFEFSYARPHTHSHEHLHSHSLVRKRVDSLICRNLVSYVLYRDVPEGSSSQFIRLIAQVTDRI